MRLPDSICIHPCTARNWGRAMNSYLELFIVAQVWLGGHLICAWLLSECYVQLRCIWDVGKLHPHQTRNGSQHRLPWHYYGCGHTHQNNLARRQKVLNYFQDMYLAAPILAWLLTLAVPHPIAASLCLCGQVQLGSQPEAEQRDSRCADANWRLLSQRRGLLGVNPNSRRMQGAAYEMVSCIQNIIHQCAHV